MNASSDWKKICPLTEVPRLGARVVKHVDGDIAIFRAADDHLFALRDRCPHKGGPLSQGIVFGHKVACPLHNWNIGLDDGQAVAPDQGCTPTYPVKLEQGWIYLDISAPGAAAGPAGGCACA